MFIKSVKLNNFKCFSNSSIEFCIPDGENLGSGLNIFVGENNVGKSTLMEAIYFLRNKGKNDYKKLLATDKDDFYVECDFTGDITSAIDNFVQSNKKDLFNSRVFEQDGHKIFRVKREFLDDEKTKKILFYNHKLDVYKNESGIDAPFQSFFQISNIWAETNPENESKYGSSTVCGNLLSDISEKFKSEHEEQYKNYLEIFYKTFNDENSGLQKDLNRVAEETEDILNNQFGKAKLKFKFDNPESNTLFKNIKIFVNDGEETDLSEKGHGMQRAVILSLLQVYAKRITEQKDQDGNIKLKPHFLFIDEPELGLHPQAQKKLFEALCVLSKTHQIFISTHCENFISTDQIKNIQKFTKINNDVKINSLKNFKSNLAPYRKFFFHHHKLFFTNKAIFVEGIDDYERYPIFCESGGFANLKKDFYLLNGCGDFGIFKDLCSSLGINYNFILDVDALSISNSPLKNFNSEIKSKISELNKVVKRKDPSNLLDSNLSESEKLIKYELISFFEKERIFILKHGAIEQYLNDLGEIQGEEMKSDLIYIFNSIDK